MLMVLIAYFLGRANYYPEPKLCWIGLDFVAHLLMVHGFHPLLDLGGGNPAMWTLAREEYFYIMYFALLAWRCRWKLSSTVLGVLALGVAFPFLMGFFLRPDSYHWHTVETSAIVLWIQWVLGMVAVEAYYGLIKLPRWSRAPWLIPLWFIAGELSRVYAHSISAFFYGMTCFTLVNFCIFAENKYSLRDRKMIVWLANVGLFSYSLYLVHYPTIMILRELFGFIAAPANPWIALIGFVVKIVICFYVAKLFFRLVERKFLNTPDSVYPLEAASTSEGKDKQMTRLPLPGAVLHSENQ
jgi:peptidoglycan/LPS O-acetylase OafA/YrhL